MPKRGHLPDDPELGAKSGKQRQREFRERRRLRRLQPNFVTPPKVIEGSGGLTYHLGGGVRGGVAAERREHERSRDRAATAATAPGADAPTSAEATIGAIPDPRPIPGVDHLRVRAKKRRLGHYAVPERYDQFVSPSERAFPDVEAIRLHDAARLKIVERRPWLAGEDWVVQAVAIELDAGARSRDEFSVFLTAVDSEGDSLLYRALLRLAVLGALRMERVSETNFYSLLPESRRINEAWTRGSCRIVTTLAKPSRSPCMTEIPSSGPRPQPA